MFGIWKSRKVDVIDHWYVLLPEFQTSTNEFYEAVEEELVRSEVPGMEVSHIQFSEGGALSSKREYLRMRRERLVFDVCSAPFGRSWFFSCRFAEIPMTIRVWEVAVLLGLLFLLHALYAFVFGLLWGSIVFGVSIVALIILMSSLQAMRLYDLDAVLLKMPVLGAFYEVFLRRNTYYREDTRLMYCDLVNGIVREKVKEVAGARDVTNVEFKKDAQPPRFGFFSLLGEAARNTWKALTKS